MTRPLESDFATFYSQSQREILFIFQSKTKMFDPLSQLLLCQGGFSCYKVLALGRLLENFEGLSGISASVMIGP